MQKTMRGHLLGGVTLFGDHGRPDPATTPQPPTALPRPTREVLDELVRASNQTTVLRHLHPRRERKAYEGEV